MGELLDLRPVFEEKRIIDASARVERLTADLLSKAFGQLSAPESPKSDCQIITLAQRASLSRRATPAVGRSR